MLHILQTKTLRLGPVKLPGEVKLHSLIKSMTSDLKETKKKNFLQIISQINELLCFVMYYIFN